MGAPSIKCKVEIFLIKSNEQILESQECVFIYSTIFFAGQKINLSLYEWYEDEEDKKSDNIEEEKRENDKPKTLTFVNDTLKVILALESTKQKRFILWFLKDNVTLKKKKKFIESESICNEGQTRLQILNKRNKQCDITDLCLTKADCEINIYEEKKYFMQESKKVDVKTQKECSVQKNEKVKEEQIDTEKIKVQTVQKDKNKIEEFQASLSQTKALHMENDNVAVRNNNAPFNSYKKFAGLYNIGNTCYFNAVLRCFLMSPIFLYHILDFAFKFGVEYRGIGADEEGKQQKFNINIKNKYNNKMYKVQNCEVLNAYIEIAFKILLKQAAHINPSSLKMILEKHIPILATQPNMQQDAHEFLCYFLDVLHSEISNFLNTKFSNQNDSCRNPIENMISIHIQQNLSCQHLHCSYKRSSMDKQRCISLDIPSNILIQSENENSKNISLVDLLKLYFSKTEVEYKCERCKCRFARKNFKIIKKPKILLLHVKRFLPNLQTLKLKKVRHYIEIVETLSLDEFSETNVQNEFTQRTEKQEVKLAEKNEKESCCSEANSIEDKENNVGNMNIANNKSCSEVLSEKQNLMKTFPSSSAKYRIKAFVLHLGISSEFGHYITYVKNYKQNVWTKWDDINQERLSDALPYEGHTDGYIFFYEKHKE